MAEHVPSILDTGERLAKEAGTTVALEASKAEGAEPAEATVTVETSGRWRKLVWGAGVWVKRKFTRGGTSAGVKGEIKF